MCQADNFYQQNLFTAFVKGAWDPRGGRAPWRGDGSRAKEGGWLEAQTAGPPSTPFAGIRPP